MFGANEKALALDFARRLSAQDYAAAHTMLSAAARSRMTREQLQAEFEQMIPPDWGDVDPIALEEDPLWSDQFLYVVLGGTVYSEAILIHAFAVDGGTPGIDRFDFGRP